MKPEVDIEVFYPHPPGKVWRALTDKRALARWLLPGDLEPRLGHKFHLRSEPRGGWDGRIAGEVTELEEERRLAYTWQSEPDQPPTLVTWTLEPAEGGTRVRLTHAGSGGPRACARGSSQARRSFRRRPAGRHVTGVGLIGEKSCR